jgi:ribonuclease VapC
MFLDASAVVAIISKEADEVELLIRMNSSNILYSAMTVFEATLALARKSDRDVDGARKTTFEFLSAASGICVPIDEQTSNEALLAHARFGKGRHRAALNVGDCFSYACARVHHVALLCKGDDFMHTDIRLA